MKKKTLSTILLSLLCVTLVSCASGGSGNPNNNPGVNNPGGGNTTIGSVYSDSERKIVYTVDYTLSTQNFTEVAQEVSSYAFSLNGYISSSETSSSYYYFEFKVPVEKLNTFLNYMEEENNEHIIRQNISTEDVTTSYNEIASKIEVLTASKAAYVAILNNNDLSYEDIITINKEIEDINAELLKLNKELSSIESITDFATIRMTIRQPTPHELEGNLSFLNSYINYLKDVGVFLFEFILYTIPFALIAGIVITIVYVIRKRKHNK
ncbi:MAG: DUF4349 domain-containing protein [Erysipelotrichaceae bacterium]|nr:DUF4349 domain-containing protein [Erysipelotrichaceae bacterium]